MVEKLFNFNDTSHALTTSEIYFVITFLMNVVQIKNWHFEKLNSKQLEISLSRSDSRVC